MKKTIAALLSALLLGGLAGCAKEPVPVGTQAEAPTVEDVFTQQVTEPSAETGETTAPIDDWTSSHFSHGFSENGTAVYEGGELHVAFDLTGAGNATVGGIGYLLFLDGQPQPYKLAEEDEYSYMCTVFPEDNVQFDFEFIFVPVTGEAGDTLVMWAIPIFDPEYRVTEDGAQGFKMSFGSMPVLKEIEFHTSPEEVDFPAVRDRVISMEVTSVDVTTLDILGWTTEELMSRSETTFSVNGESNYVTLWGCSPEDPVTLHYELWGNPNLEFGLVFYVNHQPVSAAPENLLFLQNEQGKKLVIDIQLDNSDMDKETVVYGVVVSRNALPIVVDSAGWFADVSSTYYLIAEEKPES